MKKLFFLISIFIICVSSAFSQITAITSDGKKVVLKDDKTWEYYVEKPREAVAGEKIAGDDPAALGKLVSTLKDKLKKSEYETQDQFLRRLELLFGEVVFNNKPLEDAILVATPELSYDPDAQEFRANYLKLEYEPHRTITLVKWAGFDFLMDFDIKPLKFKISPERAQAEKANIRIAVFGVPVRYTGDFYVIPAKFVLFNQQTNEMYAEILQHEEETGTAAATGAGSSSSAPVLNYNGPVRVKGYFRKDGTYVRSHTRSRPKP